MEIFFIGALVGIVATNVWTVAIVPALKHQPRGTGPGRSPARGPVGYLAWLSGTSMDATSRS